VARFWERVAAAATFDAVKIEAERRHARHAR